jgi:hypothetical protein
VTGGETALVIGGFAVAAYAVWRLGAQPNGSALAAAGAGASGAPPPLYPPLYPPSVPLVTNTITGRALAGIAAQTPTGGSIGITDPLNNPTGLGNPFGGPVLRGANGLITPLSSGAFG